MITCSLVKAFLFLSKFLTDLAYIITFHLDQTSSVHLFMFRRIAQRRWHRCFV
uniref:Uncharacterized protein n=1 Tax=Octopus bimaculoides TaxID=37653 RepID=A0A0L8HVI3_OCTBM